MNRLEQNKTFVRLWHNARFYNIMWNGETARILHQLKRDPISLAFMNPTDREWAVLSQYRVQAT